MIGTGDHTPLAGEGKTTLNAGLFAGGLQDLRVDKLHQAVTDVYHEGPAKNAHLHGGKPRAVGLGHGVGHVVQQLPELPVKNCDRLADFSEDFIPILADVSDCHLYSPFCREIRLYIHRGFYPAVKREPPVCQKES